MGGCGLRGKGRDARLYPRSLNVGTEKGWSHLSAKFSGFTLCELDLQKLIDYHIKNHVIIDFLDTYKKLKYILQIILYSTFFLWA